MTFLMGITWGLFMGLGLTGEPFWVPMILTACIMGLGWALWVSLRVKHGRIATEADRSVNTDQDVVDATNRWLADRRLGPLSRKELFFYEWVTSSVCAIGTASLAHVLIG